MLKKKLGPEAVERDWSWYIKRLKDYFKISSTLNIPEGCEHIGGYAFLGCDWLKRVEVPESVDVINYRSFWGCINATIILKKPEKDFDYIDQEAFLGCRDVKEEVWT